MLIDIMGSLKSQIEMAVALQVPGSTPDRGKIFILFLKKFFSAFGCRRREFWLESLERSFWGLFWLFFTYFAYY